MRNLEPKRAMMQKFTFLASGHYAGRFTLRRRDGVWYASSLLVNLRAMDANVNSGGTSIPIKDDQDAIDRVCYNLTHEWMHYAFHKIGHEESIEQERMIYNSIGNGGNEWFNEYYDIPLIP